MQRGSTDAILQEDTVICIYLMSITASLEINSDIPQDPRLLKYSYLSYKDKPKPTSFKMIFSPFFPQASSGRA